MHGNLDRCVKRSDEKGDKYVSRILVDDIFKLDVIPGKLDDIFTSILDHARVVLKKKRGELEEFHSRVVNTKLRRILRKLQC